MKKQKRNIILAFLLAMTMFFSGMNGTVISVESSGRNTVQLNKTEVSIKEGKSVTLKVVKKNIKKIVSKKWSTKNKSIATVNNKGKVTGKKAGKSTVIICNVEYKVTGFKKIQSKKLKCTVNVKEQTKIPEPSIVPSSTELSSALVPEIMQENQIQQNPYLSNAEAMIHNDIYNSDVTNKAMPLGIYSEIVESLATDSPNSPPAFFYDNNGNAVAPYSQILENGTILSGGIAIRDMDSNDLKVLGKFQPAIDDSSATYGIQISYSFVDKENYLVGPTTHGHIVMIQTYDDNGNILPVFKKRLDVDIVSAALKVLGDDIDKNILSITYDYQGNIWFVTGGFRKKPDYSKPGFVGYLERACIDKILSGSSVTDLEQYIHYMKLTDGENAENGIAAHKEGCVVLTNKSCYLFSAITDNSTSSIKQEWKSDYESVDIKKADPKTGITGIGLAWGGGSSPTLTNDMVLFTDNQDVVNLIALDIKTGKTLVQVPVLEDLGDDVIVSIENSISVYASDSGRASVLLCNWYGAGNAGLLDADSDSSIQTYNNIYDQNWREKGSSYLMPGIERIDIVKQEDGSYKSEKIWVRKDLKDTSMIKFSTATGYYYGYTQDEKTSEWGFIVIDYNTGETVMWQPVSKENTYNNMAVGIMQGNNGNSIYCPTNSKVLVRLQDRFAYLPEDPDKKLDIVKMERHVMTQRNFKEASGSNNIPATYLMSATINDASADEQTLSFRVNGLKGSAREYKLYYMNKYGKLNEYKETVFTDNTGHEINYTENMMPENIYEVRLQTKDSGAMDCDKETGSIKTTIILAVSNTTSKLKTNKELYDAAVKDAAIAEKDEIKPLVSLTKKDKLVTWDDKGRVLLCSWHSYPDSYPAGETVSAKWGYIWTFTDKEMATHAKELSESEDAKMRMRQLIAIDPDKNHSHVTGLWVNPDDVIRPAYQSDATKNDMLTTFPDGEEVDKTFKAWFDQNILDSYYYGNYPWTRLGYTYDWADNGKVYGLTEFLIKKDAEMEVAFTETTDEFLQRLYKH